MSATDRGGAGTTEPINAAGGGEDLGTGPDFCAARTVLRDKCQRCHQDPTQNGAPFPLLTYADTQVVDRKGVPRFQRMKARSRKRLHAANFFGARASGGAAARLGARGAARLAFERAAAR